jgi:hypothetical protein
VAIFRVSCMTAHNSLDQTPMFFILRIIPVRRIVILTLASTAVHAQAPQLAHKGSHIRFETRWRDQPVVAELRGVSRDSMVYLEECRACTPQAIARVDVERLTIEVQREDRVRRAAAGVLAGTVAGGLAGVVAGAHAGAGCHDGPCGAGVIVYTPRGAAAGAILGAFIGWFTTPRRWVAAALPSV